jgi:RNA polymerase sigma-70 factor (ECF subfamily)
VKGGFSLENNINIIRKAIRGDEKAFEFLVKEQSDVLYRTAFLYTRKKEDALDVFQDTIYKAFISIKQVKQPEFFQTWLIKILIRTAYDLLSKKKKLVLDGEVIYSRNFDNTAQAATRIDLHNAISKLNHNYQTVIILFYYHDLPIHAISEITNFPENTVKTYLYRSKAQLKEILEIGSEKIG